MRLLLSTLLILCSLNGCGYSFQGTHNPLKEVGIERIYVKSFRNRSYRAGIEQMFTTAMIRELEKSQIFKIVSDEKQADAILMGQIDAANTSPTSTKGVSVAGQDLQVSSEYSAGITCSVRLLDRFGRTIFAQSIGGSKIYSGTVLTGDQGSTAPLTNESEQRLAYQFLATQMMGSIYQRMVDIF
jgi:hypothetical protein